MNSQDQESTARDRTRSVNFWYLQIGAEERRQNVLCRTSTLVSRPSVCQPSRPLEPSRRPLKLPIQAMAHTPKLKMPSKNAAKRAPPPLFPHQIIPSPRLFTTYK